MGRGDDGTAHGKTTTTPPTPPPHDPVVIATHVITFGKRSTSTRHRMI